MTSKTITLNIGMRTRDGAELPLHRMQSCVRQTFGAGTVLFMKQCDTPGEPTLVVQVANDPHPFRLRVLELAFRLRQDCIAWKYDQNGDSEYMTGPGAYKYGPFDIKKFITKEQAMSYGHPSNPSREPYLEQRVAQLEQDVKGLCLQMTTKAASAPTQEPQAPLFTGEELGYLLALTGRLCGDSKINTQIWCKLYKMKLPGCTLHFDMASRKPSGGAPGVWLRAN